jgi:hypothetical protein
MHRPPPKSSPPELRQFWRYHWLLSKKAERRRPGPITPFLKDTDQKQVFAFLFSKTPAPNMHVLHYMHTPKDCPCDESIRLSEGSVVRHRVIEARIGVKFCRQHPIGRKRPMRRILDI